MFSVFLIYTTVAFSSSEQRGGGYLVQSERREGGEGWEGGEVEKGRWVGGREGG